VPALALIIAVLGSILGGIATPTEAASVGSIGAMILAAFRRQLTFSIVRQAVISTATITSMIFIILFGAAVFSIAFRLMGGDNLVHQLLENMPGGALGATISVMAIMYLLGFILDTIEINFIVNPITAPILMTLGVDPIWFGVAVGVNLQTSFLTPPFGFSLFYLRGVAPPKVTTGMIYKGVIPFVGLQVIGLAALFLIPAFATWLPGVLYH
jgi:tripartite ATP-independent transporter DctM subunit